MVGLFRTSFPDFTHSVMVASIWSRFVCGGPKRVRHFDAFESRAEDAGSDMNFGFLPRRLDFRLTS